jgi:hypothetical protein
MAMDLSLKAFLESGTTLRFGDDDPAANEVIKIVPFDDGHSDGDVADPIGQFLQKAELNMLKGAPVGIQETSWDAPLTKMETDLPPRSQARLEKTYAVINRVFAGHEQEAAEAREIAKQLLIETRAEFMAA